MDGFKYFILPIPHCFKKMFNTKIKSFLDIPKLNCQIKNSIEKYILKIIRFRKIFRLVAFKKSGMWGLYYQAINYDFCYDNCSHVGLLRGTGT